MFKAKRMKKVRIIVLTSIIEKLIKDLHEIGLVDVRKTKYDGLDNGRTLPAFDELSDQLIKLRAVHNLMESVMDKQVVGEPKYIEGKKALSMAKQFEAENQLRNLNQEANDLNEKIKMLDNEVVAVKKILPFKNVDFGKLSTRSIDFRIGEIPISKLPRLTAIIAKLGTGNVISEGDSNVVLILFERKHERKIDSALTDNAFIDIGLPQNITTPSETIGKVDAEINAKRSHLAKVKDDMAVIAKNNIDTVRNIIASLEVEAARAEIASKFSKSKSLHVLEGWIIGSNYDKIIDIVNKYGNKATIEEVNFGHDEMPPTVLDNPNVASPLEFITKSYSMPNYYELDPTMAYLIALPILYGMIVGDFIYGIISAILAWWLMRKFAKSYIMYNVSKIWLYSSIPTMVFGIIFDEWAGMSHYHLIEYFGKWTGIELLHSSLYTGLHRMENILLLIGLSAAMGIIHLTAGFIFGAINEWKHNKKHAFAKIAWIGVEVGMLLALLPQLGLLPLDFTVAGLVVLVISIIGLALTEGIIGIIEVPGFMGNILSYSRIAAVGIAGVVIAELLNEFLIPLPEQGLMVIIMIPIFIILHILNCFVAMFEALIQGGRLNIVEFRSKFLHGGGDVFIPFALYNKKL
ncbi:MAG: V-type ATPase 116kDa subunit family protein [Candidatus Micrarchaeota archaeon]